MDFYPLTNKIVLYKENDIYAVFFKNPVISELDQITKEIEKNKMAKNNVITKTNIKAHTNNNYEKL